MADSGRNEKPDGGEDARALREFVVTSPDYYERQFKRIGRRSSFTWTVNGVAGLLGPVWFGMRSIWRWAIVFLLVETFAWVQIVRGAFGDLGADAWKRIAQIEGTLDLRRRQLQAAIDRGAENVEVFRRTVKSLEDAIGGIRLEAQKLDDAGLWIAGTGVAILVAAKLVQAVLANPVLEKRFSEWLSEPSLARGMRRRDIALAIGVSLLIAVPTVIHYSFPGSVDLLAAFPTVDAIRLNVIKGVEQFFDFAVKNGEALFDLITYGIRLVLDALELVFVKTPWVVVFGFIVLLTGLSAGLRAAIWSGAFLAYMGILGFWVKAMTTLALLGTAACLSIAIGIPLGMFCARRPRVYAFIRPIMDFMQTMPAFVFMIPVIAFFGTGKPAAVVTTMIFGGTPVVRLTVLGLRSVPENVREAAIAFGASKWYLLTRVDLPLASPSIRAGVNQTIMLSLAMVVVASLIGAKGLGEDVLEALQYANVGQGILAGFSILFCAMILDRVVQGRAAK
ncbi:MAG: ABC transporter permease subunit [Burkholderiaceae bacterium]|nr:ABC transporter permease subunit [Burkholderiaceae bacterium]